MNSPTAPSSRFVFHDIQPMFFTLQRIARRALGERLTVFAGGNERRPASAEKLATFVASRPDCWYFAARFAQPVLSSIAGAHLRSIVPVAHPILRALHCIELAWTQHADAQVNVSAEEGALVTLMAKGLAQPLERYPYVNFHVGLVSGDVHTKSRSLAPMLAESLSGHAGIGLVDFPQTLFAMMKNALEPAGIVFEANPEWNATRPAAMLETLRRWADALPAAAWSRLIQLNTADLVFFDAIAAAICRDETHPQALRDEIREAIEAAAEVTQHRQTSAIAKPLADTSQAASKSLIEPDPVLGWRLRAGHEITLNVADQPVVMQVDASGFRPVPAQPTDVKHTLALYGCSCVFGWAVPVEHTVCALLQRRLPNWRIENHGVNGYGQGQNLLQLMQNLRWGSCEFVTFCWIAPHLTRNVADVIQVQQQTERAGAGKASLIRFMPRACLQDDGDIRFREVSYARPELAHLDLSEFAPDPHYLDLVCFALLRRAAKLVAERGGHFFVTILLDQLSPSLRRMLMDAEIPVLDASVAGPEYINPLQLSHPNAAANHFYADWIEDYLARRIEGIQP